MQIVLTEQEYNELKKGKPLGDYSIRDLLYELSHRKGVKTISQEDVIFSSRIIKAYYEDKDCSFDLKIQEV